MSFDAPSVLFRLEVAEASREREGAKLHEATQELVQGESLSKPKKIGQKDVLTTSSYSLV